MGKKRQTDYNKILTNIFNALYKAFGPQHWWPGETPFEVAVGAILTQNTNWGNVEKAINNLKNSSALDPHILHKMPHQKLASLIKPSGYFNIKAKRLKHFLAFLVNHYNGRVENMQNENALMLRHQLLEINGIGPETADSILLYALEKPFFVIDAYTKRVLARHKIVPEEATYHEIQELFHKNLPMDVKLFNEYHALFVMAGKHYCKPKPRCEECPLKGLLNKKLSFVRIVSSGRRHISGKHDKFLSDETMKVQRRSKAEITVSRMRKTSLKKGLSNLSQKDIESEIHSARQARKRLK